MLLAGPVREVGDTDKISSGCSSDGGRIGKGLKFRRAANLLMNMIKVTIVRGELPGSCAALNAVLNEPIILSTLAWLKEALLKGILVSNLSFLRPVISSLACWLSTVASSWVSSSSWRSDTAPLVSCTAVIRDDPGSIATLRVAQTLVEMIFWIAVYRTPVVMSSSRLTSSLEVM